jgi:hypothetical protein
LASSHLNQVPLIQVCIISNGNESRLRTARGAIEQFTGEGGGGRFDLRVVEWQPEFFAPPRWARLVRSLQSLTSSLKLHRSPLVTAKLWLGHIVGLFGALSGPRSRNSKRAFAELALTEKHIRCLTGFLESESDYLMVLEDDVSCAADSNLDYQALLSTLEHLKDKACFLSLSKAFTLKELGLQNRVREYNEYFIDVPKSMTNTAAAYIVTKGFAEKAMRIILLENSLRRLPADWMLTSIMTRATSMVCLHAKKGPFVNGSLLGLTPSEVSP